MGVFALIRKSENQFCFSLLPSVFELLREELDTLKILYEVSKNVQEELSILRILEDSLGFLEDSWGFLRFPGDSKGFLRILESQDHGDYRVSVRFCRSPWGFLGILWVSLKSVQGF